MDLQVHTDMGHLNNNKIRPRPLHHTGVNKSEDVQKLQRIVTEGQSPTCQDEVLSRPAAFFFSK